MKDLSPMTNSPIRMLLVEDPQHDADSISMLLTRTHEFAVDVDQVTSLTEAIDASQQRQYDIVLLDLGHPNGANDKLVSRLRDCAPNTPIVVVNDEDRNGTSVASIDDSSPEILPKQRVVARLLTRMMRHSISRHHQLVQAQSDALMDVLTGHANRRACEAEIERRLSDFERHGHPFCVALFDIDHFKRINDRWGHEAGDQVIKAVASALDDNSRISDQLARYGGEEFAITFAMTRLPIAQRTVLRCHQAVSQLLVGEERLRVTVSAGTAQITAQDNARTLLARADGALYAAKLAGRNRCMPHHMGRITDRARRSMGTEASAPQ
jgi:diguanylate cyclase (GGDEF)-like protein